jgi:ribose-phosphate pyrophosphokinase
MKIIGGISSQSVSKRISDMLDIPIAATEYKTFPDGEKYCRILDRIDGEDVLIIQSISSDSDLIYLLEIIDACKNLEVGKKVVLMPYFGYARQDKMFEIGEPISARVIAGLIRADKVYTINIHSKSVLNFFNSPVEDLNAMPLLIDHIKGMNLTDPIVIAPDEGSADTVFNTVSNYYDFDYMEKTRISSDKVVIKPKNLDVNGRDIVIMDDMISTGGTVLETAKMLKENGANDVYAFCVHPVLVGHTLLRLYTAGIKEVISTDTIEKITSKVSIAPLVAERLKSMI